MWVWGEVPRFNYIHHLESMTKCVMIRKGSARKNILIYTTHRAEETQIPDLPHKVVDRGKKEGKLGNANRSETLRYAGKKQEKP